MFGDCEYLQLGYDDVEKTIYMIPKSSQKEGRKVSVLPKSGNVMYVSWGPFLHRNDIFFGKPCDCKIQDAGVVDKKGKKIVISNCK